MRKKAADAASLAAVAEQRKADALLVLDQLDAHRFIAATLHAQAKDAGVDVKFMPTPSGVVAVEGRDGAAETMLANFQYFTREGGSARRPAPPWRRRIILVVPSSHAKQQKRAARPWRAAATLSSCAPIRITLPREGA
jgi:hypothetical protein